MELARPKQLIAASLAIVALGAAGVAYAADERATSGSEVTGSAAHPNATPGPHGATPPGYSFGPARD